MVIGCSLTLLVFAFPVVLADLGPGPTFYYRLLVFPADITIAVTAIAAAIVFVAQGRRSGPGVTLLGVLTLALAIAFAFHPSPQGMQTVARFAGVTGVAFALSVFRREERALAVAVLAIAALAEVALGLAQMGAGGPLGLPSFGEVADPLLDYDGVAVPRGTMHSVTALAGLGLVTATLVAREGLAAAFAGPVFAAAGIASALVGITFSRAAALGLTAACAALALGARMRPRRVAAALVCLALGAAIPAVYFHTGWQHRANLSLSGRDVITEQALGLIWDSPIVGVGPGRSLFALPEKYPDPPRFGYQPAHAFPLIATVEGGTAAGAVSVALLLVLAWRARRDMRALAIYLAFVPVVLTDHYPYTFLQGQVLLAAWIGSLDGLAGEAALALPADRLVRRLFGRRFGLVFRRAR